MSTEAKPRIYLAGKVKGKKWKIADAVKAYEFVATDGGSHAPYDAHNHHEIKTFGQASNWLAAEFISKVLTCKKLVAYLDTPDSFGSVAEIVYASGSGIPCEMYVLDTNEYEYPDKMQDAYWFVSNFPRVTAKWVSGVEEVIDLMLPHPDRMSYKEYLQTDHWKQTRKEALDRAGNKCSVCGATARLQVHHNSYQRLGKEIPTDLTVLCDPCHSVFHERRKLATSA